MLFIIMGVSTAFNILIIFKKIELERYQDAFFDGGLLILLTLVFGGSLGGMMVATVASFVISFYFLFNEPKFDLLKEETEDISIKDISTKDISIDMLKESQERLNKILKI